MGGKLERRFFLLRGLVVDGRSVGVDDFALFFFLCGFFYYLFCLFYLGFFLWIRFFFK